MRTLPLTVDEFDSLAAGHGSDSALAHLVAGQLAKRRLLLWGAVRDARRLGIPVDEPVALLLRVLERSPAAFDEVIAHPQVDAWAAGFPEKIDINYLYGLAAAAAMRARMPFALDTAASLPGLGLVTGKELTFDGTRVTTGELQSLLLLDLTDVDGPVIAVDHLDQYRDRYGETVAAQLPDPDRFAARWREAWELLAADHPAHARAVRAMLRSFVPLEPTTDGMERSGVSSRANGSIAIALPATAAAMARLVLHETQHLKLDALLDLVDLTQGDGRPRHYAPWRGDPRPARSLLQGTYAHLGVAEFWRGRDARQFAYWHGQTARAAITLAASGELTADGERFVAGMRATLDDWADDPVPAADRHAADVCAKVSELVWRLGHRALSGDALVAAWRAGTPAPADLEGEAQQGRSGGARILSAIHGGRLSDGDRELLAGDDHAAAQHYVQRITAGDATNDDWAGLAVATAATARPEVARDVYAAVRPADPRDLLRWSAG
ncbi:HEXXH motif-containing putative peptide modification protein [Actinoplanes sp. NPDC026619]|uniref:aKG-HExxH-type peptide beta-hydroxylase n=1 Tax=Actinoplanes sp. NPDC026619 TaxID=3155798 RepID=UPI0033E09152